MTHENITRDENWTLTVKIDSDAGEITLTSDYGPDSGSCITLKGSGLSVHGMRAVVDAMCSLCGRNDEIRAAFDTARVACGGNF